MKNQSILQWNQQKYPQKLLKNESHAYSQRMKSSIKCYSRWRQSALYAYDVVVLKFLRILLKCVIRPLKWRLNCLLEHVHFRPQLNHQSVAIRVIFLIMCRSVFFRHNHVTNIGWRPSWRHSPWRITCSPWLFRNLANRFLFVPTTTPSRAMCFALCIHTIDYFIGVDKCGSTSVARIEFGMYNEMCVCFGVFLRTQICNHLADGTHSVGVDFLECFVVFSVCSINERFYSQCHLYHYGKARIQASLSERTIVAVRTHKTANVFFTRCSNAEHFSHRNCVTRPGTIDV